MNRVSYGYGSGTATVFWSLKTNRIFNCFNEEDRAALHEIYGGKQYYYSRSGSSGAGYLQPVMMDNDLVSLPVYRDAITYLSEAYPQEVNGVIVMYPVERGHNQSPIVIVKNDVIFFTKDVETMARLILSGPEDMLEHNINTWWYEYHKHNKMSVEWASDYIRGEALSFPSSILPYNLTSFITLLLPHKVTQCLRHSYRCADSDQEELKIDFIGKKINIGITTDGRALRLGLFGFVKEEISKEELAARFQEGQYFEWPNHWTTSKNFAFRRYGEGVCAVYEALPIEFGEKYSVLEGKMEYEQNFSIFEWFSASPETHAAGMKKKLFGKIRNEYVHSSRWSAHQKISKVREILAEHPDAQVFIQDSIDSGNCIPGTQEFMRKFSLVDGMTCRELQEHEKFEEILKNTRFLAVILSKFIIEED